MGLVGEDGRVDTASEWTDKTFENLVMAFCIFP